MEYRLKTCGSWNQFKKKRKHHLHVETMTDANLTTQSFVANLPFNMGDKEMVELCQ